MRAMPISRALAPLRPFRCRARLGRLAPGALCLALALGCTQERADPRKDSHDRWRESKPESEPPSMVTPRTAAAPLSLEEVAKYPLPGTSIAGSFQWSPDGRSLTMLDSADGSLVRQLWVEPVDGSAPRRVMFEPEGGEREEDLSPEEKLQRERKRERNLGVTQYAWAEQGTRVLVPVRGELWVQDGPDAAPRRLVDAEAGPALDPLLSPDGKRLAWVRDAEVYVLDDVDAGGEPRQLTQGARGTGKTNGLAEYVAQEEMDRHRGFWWSRDGERIAYAEVDETHIPRYRIAHQGAGEPDAYEEHGYPFAGRANARVRLGVVPRGGGPTVWMQLRLEGEPDDELYLARVHWLPDGGLAAQLENRAQTRLDLVRFDPATGEGTPLLSERSDVWVNLHDDFRALEGKGEPSLAGALLWSSEGTGFRHLYLHDRDGKLLRALTSGEWMVDHVVGVDEAGGQVYFTATKDGPTEQHLYRVPLAGGEVVRITTEPGVHAIAMARDCSTFVDTWSDLDTPPRITLRRADGTALRALPVADDPRVAALRLPPPRLVTLRSRDGVELHAALYQPPAGAGPAPAIVSVYGGPHAQRVTRSWGMTVDLRAQYLASLGFVVWKLDNRGSARRGLRFEGAIKNDMGNLEVEDQVDGVRWLVAEGLVDPARVGIYGWSYGGYMAAMALARAPETFKAAVAGAPVTSWDGYDTHYTERYMGTPASNPSGYASSSVLTHVPNIRGSLMIVHGLIDENVHFRHAARLIDALVKARKPHDLMLFPSERHMPRSEADRVYMEERMRDFFVEQLGPVALVQG